MRALAIDTGGPALGVAAVEISRGQVQILALAEEHTALRHIESLPRIPHTVLNGLGWKPEELDGVLVASGPGSFTGLRVGMAAAKGIALAADCPVVSVNSLEAIAATVVRNTPDPKPLLIVPMIDARKKRYYAAIFHSAGRADMDAECNTSYISSSIRRIGPDRDIDPSRLADYLSDSITGAFMADPVQTHAAEPVHPPGTPPFPTLVPSGPDLPDDALLMELFARVKVTDSSRPIQIQPLRIATAVTGVAITGIRTLEAGIVDDPWKGPDYLRDGDTGTPRVYQQFSS